MREVLVRDLGQCIHCSTCVTACQNRHGRARMTLTGPRYGHYQLPDVCRHCPDTLCVQACRFGGMREESGKTFVSASCRGCNRCVEACPYGVIRRVPRESRQGLIASLFSGWLRTSESSSRNFKILSDAARCVQCGICSAHCPAGVPVRSFAREGHIVDDARCTGCGLCIAQCPRGTLRFETYPVLPTPAFRADKCDLCRGHAESACVKECPTGALMRLAADGELAMLNDGLARAVLMPAAEPDEEALGIPIECPIIMSS